MKNKSKVILGLSSILAVSAGVAGVSTFAWFTTQRTASATVASLSVHSRDGSITIKANGVDKGGVTANPNDTYGSTASLTGTGTMNDVSSGDGINFYHPTWKAGKMGTEASAIPGYTANPDATNLYFREFTLTFKNNGSTGDNAFDIYLTSGCKIEADANGDATKNANAATAMRMAILDSTKTTLLAYWQYGVEGAAADPATDTKPYQYNYISATGTKTAYTVADKFLADASTISKATLATTGTTNDFADINSTSITAGQKANQKLTTTALTAGSEVTIDVRFWIEGTADVCTTALADGGVAKATLQFAAL